MRVSNATFCFDENYAEHFFVSAKSLIDNLNILEKIYILSINLRPRTKRRIMKFADKYGVSVSIHTLDLSNYEFSQHGHLNNAAYLRLFIPEYVTEETTVYLDVDIIVIDNVDELFSSNKTLDNPICAAKDQGMTGQHLDVRDYFNTGVMILNLDKLRQMQFTQTTIKYAEILKDRIKFADQCIINFLFSHEIKELNVSYNFQKPNFEHGLKQAIEKSSPKVIHFTSSDKPWYLNKRSHGQALYWKIKLNDAYGWLYLVNRLIAGTCSKFLPSKFVRKLNNLRKLRNKRVF